MFASSFMSEDTPMSDQPEKWPRVILDGSQRPPTCMSEAEYATCEKDEETGKVIDILGEVVERKDAVKFPETPQCYTRESLRHIVKSYGYRNPANRQEVEEKWLDEQLAEGDCVEAATGGRRRRHRRKTKKSRNQAKRVGSRKARKGRKAGRRTRNAKKYAKRPKAKATRRHRRNR